MRTVEQIKNAIQVLQDGLDSGATAVAVDGTSTTFGSLNDRQVALNNLHRELHTAERVAHRRPRVSSVDLTGGA